MLSLRSLILAAVSAVALALPAIGGTPTASAIATSAGDPVVIDPGYGLPIVYAFDNNKDGTFDRISIDTNRDGKLDMGVVDVDFDGTWDAIWADKNGNGILEPGEYKVLKEIGYDGPPVVTCPVELVSLSLVSCPSANPVDTDRDGRVDALAVDLNRDRRVDLAVLFGPQEQPGLPILVLHDTVMGHTFTLNETDIVFFGDRFDVIFDFGDRVDGPVATGGTPAPARTMCIPVPRQDPPRRGRGNFDYSARYAGLKQTDANGAQSEWLKGLLRDVLGTGVVREDWAAFYGLPAGLKYVEKYFDCDDFARFMEIRLTEAGYDATFTVYWCKQKDGSYSGHALTDVHAPDGTVTWIEPQTGQVANLDFNGDGTVGTATGHRPHTWHTEGNCRIEFYDSQAAAVAAGVVLD